MKLTYTAICEKITVLNMKHGTEIMNKIIYDLYKKRNYALLDRNQLEKVLEAMETHFNMKGI